MNSGRPVIGATIAWAVSGLRPMAGKRNRPPPTASENAEPAGAPAAVAGETAWDADSWSRAWLTASAASCTAARDPAASTTDVEGVRGALSPRNGSSTKSTSIAAKGTRRPLILMFRTSGPLP